MVKKVKRIWILNHHASGNGDRHDEIAKQFTKLGIEVVIIASSYKHAELKYAYDDKWIVQDFQNGLKYIWLHTTPAYQRNGLKRILNMVSYMNMVKRYSKVWYKDFGKPDVIIGSSVHPFAWEAAYWLSKKTKAAFYAEVRDLWPLSLIEVQGLTPRHPLVLFFGMLEKRAYRRAKKIITSMPYAYKYISETLKFPREKTIWIPNGLDTEKVDNSLNNFEVKLPYELNKFLEENWCTVYTGSLVESECIDYILDSAEILQNRGNDIIKFAIVGNGRLKKQLREEVKKRNLRNVRFFDRVSKEQVSKVVNKAKVCLAAVGNLPLYKYGLSMNKLNDYLYSGNPTIFVCDVDNVVSISGGGISLPYGNREIYANSIENLFKMSENEREIISNRGIKTIKEEYDTAILVQKLLSVFNNN
jgi:glycosyltransferase involved in cell wall biosynthesis